MQIDLTSLTELAKQAAWDAGKEIVKIYEAAEFGVEYKQDKSPLTLADRAAHQVIVRYLDETQIPVLSEEGMETPYAERSAWEYFWMVDPLDGTKEFIRKNGEFTVNIALIHQGEPVLGVVYAPILDWMYWGFEQGGSWKQVGTGIPESLHIPSEAQVRTIVASRSHLNAETQAFLDKYSDAEIVSMGSSLKFMLVAENKAQVYPRFAPTMEWDTAAAHGILRAMGAEVVLADGSRPLTYNKQNLLNPHFICYNTPYRPI